MGNIQPKLLSNNIKIIRSNLQYIISILQSVDNSEIIDVTMNFLFGFNVDKTARVMHENSSESISNLMASSELSIIMSLENIDVVDYYNYSKHKASKLSLLILNSILNEKNHLNIVVFELFEIFFTKRPFVMMKQFVEPYTSFCLKEKEKSKKYINIRKNYPQLKPLYEVLNNYPEIEDPQNLEKNIEANMFKNYSFYINYELNFYHYYEQIQNYKKKENKSINEINESNKEEDIDILERQLTSNQDENSKKKEVNQEITNDLIVLDDKLFDEIDETVEEFNNQNVKLYLILYSLFS